MHFGRGLTGIEEMFAVHALFFQALFGLLVMHPPNLLFGLLQGCL